MRILIGLLVALVMLTPGTGIAGERLELEVQDVTLSKDSGAPGQLALQIELTATSGAAFAAFPGKHVGETVELCADEVPVMSPRLIEPILGAKIMVSGNFAAGELEGMARKIADNQAKVSVRTQGE